jgi:hypothetical protein
MATILIVPDALTVRLTAGTSTPRERLALAHEEPDIFPVSGHSEPKAIRLTLDFPSTTASTYGTRSRGMRTASQSDWRCKPRDLRAAQSLGHNVALKVSAGLSCKDSKTLQ